MNKINKLTELDAAYIAGIIDGEGCVMLSQNHFGDILRTPSYALRLRVKMTDELVIRWLHSTIGGRFYTEKKSLKSSKWKDCYEWSCVGKNAVKVLKQVYPYLRVKKSQADVAFQFIKTMHRVENRGKPLSNEVIKERAVLRNRIVGLNA